MNEADEVQPDDSVDPAQADAGVTDADAHSESDPVIETVAEEGNTDASEPKALAPGGKRWNQLYARTKTAESEAQQLREEKARLEGQLEATRTAPPVPEPKPEPRHSWTQLEAAIADGKITQAQAMEYREETIRAELEAKFDAKLQHDRTTRERGTSISDELAQYKQAAPEILTLGTPERKKVEREFNYLLGKGFDKNDLRTELLACRAALGDVETVKEQRAASRIPNGRDTMQDIPANGKPKPDPKDPLKDLSGVKKQHYQRMIDKGVYKGWAEVREELKEYA
jgi:hypothetical protein